MARDIALYIHIPFCRRKCGYCSFVSYAGREADMPAYIDSVKQELASQSAGQRLVSIYLGGGTPSLLPPEQLRGLLSSVRSLFVVAARAEVSMEANPDSLDEQYLASALAWGINRLSVGVQSLDDRDLALLGRIHTAAQAADAVRLARRAGCGNLNLDLIYGVPGQSLDRWRRTLEKAAALGPEHLSLYPLTLDGDVPLRLAIEQGALPPIDPDLAADQYELAEQLLESYGYQHYEISNWARAGCECRHNLVYWRNLPYLGVGAAAHSCVHGRRSANTADVDEYMAASARRPFVARSWEEEIGPELELCETVILGLRLSEGISLQGLSTRFGVDPLERYGPQVNELVALGLLDHSGGSMRLTRRGRLLGNEAFHRFLPDQPVSS